MGRASRAFGWASVGPASDSPRGTQVFRQYAEICNVSEDQLNFVADGKEVHPGTTPDRITEPPVVKPPAPVVVAPESVMPLLPSQSTASTALTSVLPRSSVHRRSRRLTQRRSGCEVAAATGRQPGGSQGGQPGRPSQRGLVACLVGSWVLVGVALCHMRPRVSGCLSRCLVEMSPEPPSFSLLLSLSLSPLLRPSSDFRARSAPGTLHFYMRASSARSGLGLETPEGARIE